MDRETDAAEGVTDATAQQGALVDKMSSGFLTRLIARLRTRIRRLFKKEDPNIYPFF